MNWRIDSRQPEEWVDNKKMLVNNLHQARVNIYKQKAAGTTKIYKELDWSRGEIYIKKYGIDLSMWIMRARSDMLILNNNKFAIGKKLAPCAILEN